MPETNPPIPNPSQPSLPHREPVKVEMVVEVAERPAIAEAPRMAVAIELRIRKVYRSQRRRLGVSECLVCQARATEIGRGSPGVVESGKPRLIIFSLCTVIIATCHYSCKGVGTDPKAPSPWPGPPAPPPGGPPKPDAVTSSCFIVPLSMGQSL